MVAAVERTAAPLWEESVTASVSVIVPTYNERENIETVLDRCSDVLEASGYEFEIIVVDDDSPDRTWEIVEETHGDDDRVRVLRRTENRGLARAVTAGFRAATMDCCVVIDGDLQHPPERVSTLLAALDEGADIAIGSRHVEGGGIGDWSRFRAAVSKGATGLAKLAVPAARGVSDPMSGLFAVHRSVLEIDRLEPQGYKILLEILSKCEVEQVVEVPYTFRERAAGESKLTPAQYQRFVEHVLTLVASGWAPLSVTDPKRAVRLAEFLCVGAIGVLVNTLLFVAALGSGAHYLLAGGLAFLAAVQWNFAGNWLVTFDRPRGALVRQYLRFHGVCVAGFVIYESVLAVLMAVPGRPTVLANIGAIAASAGWNFVGSDAAVFADADDAESRIEAEADGWASPTLTADFEWSEDQ
jgi:dolichol-phosphate mannosyltransferase